MVTFQNNSVFYNSHFKWIEQGVVRIDSITNSRYYMAIFEMGEIVFKLLASHCIYLCGIFAHLESHHIQLRSFGTLQKIFESLAFDEKTKFWPLMIHCGKVPRVGLWFSHFTTSFMCLNFWNFENCHEITWNFAQIIESVFVVEKTWFGFPSRNLSAFGECHRFHLYSFQGPSLWYLS